MGRKGPGGSPVTKGGGLLSTPVRVLGTVKSFFGPPSTGVVFDRHGVIQVPRWVIFVQRVGEEKNFTKVMKNPMSTKNHCTYSRNYPLKTLKVRGRIRSMVRVGSRLKRWDTQLHRQGTLPSMDRVTQ